MNSFTRKINISDKLKRLLFRIPQGHDNTLKYYSKTEAPPEYDKPIEFSRSKASRVTFQDSYVGSPLNIFPWYQPIVISVSLVVFLVYFCILREENDVDGKLSLTLYDHIEGLEELQIRQSISYNKEKGLDTKALEHRLREIEKEKQEFKSRY